MARGLPTGGQGSKVYVLCAEPKEYKRFRPGTRPEESGVPAGRIDDRGDREIVYVPNPEGPARHLDASQQKLTPHCLTAIFDSQLPSPKVSLKMPPPGGSVTRVTEKLFMCQMFMCLSLGSTQRAPVQRAPEENKILVKF